MVLIAMGTLLSRASPQLEPAVEQSLAACERPSIIEDSVAVGNSPTCVIVGNG